MPSLVVVVKCDSRHVFIDCEAGRSYSYTGFERLWLPLLGKRQIVGSIAQSDIPSQDQVTNTDETPTSTNLDQPPSSGSQIASELDSPATPTSTNPSPTTSSNSSRVLSIVLPLVFAIMAVTGAFFFLRIKSKKRQAKSSGSCKAIKPKTRKNSQPEKNARSSSRARYEKSDKENHLNGDVNRQDGNISSIAPALSSINPSSLGKEVKSTDINSESGHLSPVKVVEISHPADLTSPSSSMSALATAPKGGSTSGSKNISMIPATTTSSSRHVEKSSKLGPGNLTPPKVPSFWKRLSQPRSSTAKKSREDDVKAIPKALSDPELHITNATLATSQSAPRLASVPQISLDSPQALEQQLRGANTGGLAGIGVRDRNSIASFALSGSNVEAPTRKLNARSLSNYSPATSSPLSSQAECEEEILPTAGPSSARPQSHQPRLSYQSPATRLPRPASNRSRLSYQQNRLSFIPDGSVTGSEDLMKMLRGPSAYPDEARPRSIVSYSAPNSRPASRLGRPNEEF